MVAESEGAIEPGDVASFELRERVVPPSPGRLGFDGPGMAVGYDESRLDTDARRRDG